MARLALYDFTEGSGTLVANKESTGNLYNLNLELTNGAGSSVWNVTQGLSLSGGAKLRSASAGAAFSSAVRASTGYAVEFWVVPANATQTGPARLIELGLVPVTSTNLVLGATVDTYTARGRRNATDTWGIQLVVQSLSNTVIASLPQHIVFSQAASGEGQLWINGVDVGSTSNGPVTLSAWHATAELFLGNNLAGDRAYLGEFKKVALFDNPLTNADVTAMFTAGYTASSAGIGGTISASSGALAGTISATGGENPVIWQTKSIQPDPANPRFFKFDNTPIYLLGASDDDEIFNWTPAQRNAHLDLMQANGGNFIRNVLNTSTTHIASLGGYGRETDGLMLQPFLKFTSGPNSGLYDLSQYNQVWFDRLAAFLAECESRSIIVALTLWELWDFIEISTQRYHTNAWNPTNNINYNSTQSGLPTYNISIFPWTSAWTTAIRFGFTVPALDNRTIVLNLQKAFITKVMQTCLPYTNVLYNMVNERMDQSAPLQFADYWIQFIKDRAAEQGKTIQTTDMSNGWTYTAHQSLIGRTNLSSYEVSQMGNSGGQAHYDAVISTRNQLNGSKPMIAAKYYVDYDYGTNLGPNEPVDKMFRTMFAGVAAGRLHRPTDKTMSGIYDTQGLGLGFTYNSDQPGRRVLKAARMFSDAVDMFSMTPDNGILSGRLVNESYALRTANSQIGLYFTGKDNASVTVNISSLPSGNYQLKRLDVFTGTWQTVNQSIARPAISSLNVSGAAGTQTLFLIEQGAAISKIAGGTVGASSGALSGVIDAQGTIYAGGNLSAQSGSLSGAILSQALTISTGTITARSGSLSGVISVFGATGRIIARSGQLSGTIHNTLPGTIEVSDVEPRCPALRIVTLIRRLRRKCA